MTDTTAARGEAGEIRDGMLIEWDVEIPMDDGITMRSSPTFATRNRSASASCVIGSNQIRSR